MGKSRHREVRYQECEAGYELSWCQTLELSWCQVLWLCFKVNCQHGEYLACGSSHKRSSINKQVDREAGERQGLRQFSFYWKQISPTALHCLPPGPWTGCSCLLPDSDRWYTKTKAWGGWPGAAWKVWEQRSHIFPNYPRDTWSGEETVPEATQETTSFYTHLWRQLASRKAPCFLSLILH